MAMLAQDGRELNVQLASRVMGWTQWTDLSGDCPCEPGVTYFADWGDSPGVAVYRADDASGDVAFYFNPVEEIADAWKVIEKLEWMAPAIYRGYSFNWGCRFGDAHGEGDTAPLAICRAAFAALQPDEAQPMKRCFIPWCGVERLCVDCANPAA